MTGWNKVKLPLTEQVNRAMPPNSDIAWILTLTLFSAPLWYCKECGALCSILPLESILPIGDSLESLQRHLEAAYLNGMLLVLKLKLKDMPFLLWQVLHSNSHAILLSSMSDKKFRASRSIRGYMKDTTNGTITNRNSPSLEIHLRYSCCLYNQEPNPAGLHHKTF